jgi:ectoine hydroxylase-related dioxygenase (phytanoyl-CoA dioxygenase family)
MTPSEALQSLEVHPDLLSAGERRFLDENGYLPLDGILTEDEVAYVRSRLDELAEIEGDDAGSELSQEEGAVRLANLLDKDPFFEKFITTPRVLAGITHVIGDDIQLSSLSSRAALPNGYGQQVLHTDWSEAVTPGNYFVCNSAWLIDDYTEDNGSTRVIPGSHRWEELPEDALADCLADHPDQVNLTGRAGTVVVFNSHLWHGGRANRTSFLRRGVLSYFVRRPAPRIQNDHKQLLSKETKARLSTEALTLAAAE